VLLVLMHLPALKETGTEDSMGFGTLHFYVHTMLQFAMHVTSLDIPLLLIIWHLVGRKMFQLHV